MEQVIFICSQCGKESLRIRTENNYIHPCTFCNSKMIESPYDYKTYKKMKKNNEWDKFVSSFIQEYKNNPNYQGKQSKDYSSLKSNTDSNPIPRCPTCGSTNIRHISGTERAANIFAFGLLGNKRKCQFECQNPNCRYRW